MASTYGDFAGPTYGDMGGGLASYGAFGDQAAQTALRVRLTADGPTNSGSSRRPTHTGSSRRPAHTGTTTEQGR